MSAWKAVDGFVTRPGAAVTWQVRQDAASTPRPGVWQDSHCGPRNACALDSGPGFAAAVHNGVRAEPERWTTVGTAMAAARPKAVSAA